MERKPWFYSNLTNEAILKRFGNQFELVNYAITVAEEMIRAGREPRVKSAIQNRAFLILEEIVQGLDGQPAVLARPISAGLVTSSDALAKAEFAEEIPTGPFVELEEDDEAEDDEVEEGDVEEDEEEVSVEVDNDELP